MKQTTTKFFSLAALLFSFVLWSGSASLLAQNKKIDSLVAYIKSAKLDTQHVNASVLLTKLYLKTSQYDNALQQSMHTQELVQKLLSGANTSVTVFLKKNLGAAYNNEGNVYYYHGDFPKCMSMYNKALVLYEEIDDKKGIANCINNLGLIAYTQANYNKAYDYYAQALKIREQVGDLPGQASSFNNLALVFEHQGNYTACLEAHFKSLAIAEKLGDKFGIANSLSNIGVVYSNQNNNAKALEYYVRARVLLEEIGNKNILANVYNNIGIIYERQKNFSAALSNHQLALKVREQINEPYGIAASYNNLGTIYFSQRNYSAALEYNLKALQIREEIQDSLGIAMSLSSVANCYAHMNDLKKAEDFCLRSLGIATKAGDREAMKEANKVLSDIYARLHDFEKAYKYHTLFTDLSDSLLNQENLKQSVRAEMNYEFAKKEAFKLAEQEKRDAITEVHEHRQKLIIWGVSGIAFLVLGFAVFAYRSYLRKQKDHAEIVQQKYIIEEKQKEILSSIHYAKRIQKVLLPQERYIQKTLSRLHSEKNR